MAIVAKEVAALVLNEVVAMPTADLLTATRKRARKTRETREHRRVWSGANFLRPRAAVAQKK